MSEMTLENISLNDWDIASRQLYRKNAAGIYSPTEVSELTTTDLPDLIIGKAYNPDTFKPITNRMFLDTIREAIKEIPGSKIESAGSVMGRGRIFVTISVPQALESKIGKRDFRNYLTFGLGRDFVTPFFVTASNVCTVCNNTFNSNLMIGNDPVNIRYKQTKNIAFKLDNVPQIIAGWLGAIKNFEINFGKMDKQKVTLDFAQKFIVGFLANDTEGEFSTRKQNQANELLSLFVRGKGNSGETAGDLFSAFTDYYTHNSSGGTDVMKQLVSSEYGSGNKQKARVFGLLSDDKEMEAVFASGKDLLDGLVNKPVKVVHHSTGGDILKGLLSR